MKTKKILLWTIIISSLSVLVKAQNFPVLKGPYLGQTQPGKTAQLFAPQIISTELHDDGAPAFNKDGTEIYFRIVFKKAGKIYGTIFFMEVKDDVWTAPKIASFAKEYTLWGGIVFSPDGNRLYTAVNTAPDGSYNMDLAYVDRKHNTWTKPVIVNDLNSPGDELAFFGNKNGDVYWTIEPKTDDIEKSHYSARYIDSSYSEIRQITSFPKTAIVDCQAKDGSYVIFSADEDGNNRDLFVCFKKANGRWGNPVNLGPDVNSPWMEKCASITLDGKYLFFVSSRPGEGTQPQKLWNLELFTNLEDIWRCDVYWVDTSVIDDLKKEKLK